MSKQAALGKVFAALQFAAQKHRFQRRKDQHFSPYINHPIEVAELLVHVGGVDDEEILMAALLHDTIEDTDTTREELKEAFGERVLSLVLECTDDKSLPKEERKQLQVEHAAHKSPGAKLIKIADKISNVSDITKSPPASWSLDRREEYLNWSERVVNGLRGGNKELDSLYDGVLKEGREKIKVDRAAEPKDG